MHIFIPAKQRAKRKLACTWRLPQGSNTLWLAAGYLTDFDYTAPYFRSQPVIGKSFSFPAHLFYLSVLLPQIFPCPENFASFLLPKFSPDTHFVSQNAIRSVAQPLKPHNIPINSVKQEIYIIATPKFAKSTPLLHHFPNLYRIAFLQKIRAVSRPTQHHTYIISFCTISSAAILTLFIRPTPFIKLATFNIDTTQIKPK